MLSRRAVVAASLLAGIGQRAGAQVAQQLVLSTFGIGQDQFRRHLYEPFEKAAGARVVAEVGNVTDRLTRLEARRANPNVDLIAITDIAAYEGMQKGLLDPVDPALIPNHAKLFDFARNPIGGMMGIGYTFYSTSIVYRTDKIGKIESWTDLFRPELRGRIALPAIATSQAPLTLMMLERAIGGTSEHFGGAIDLVARNREHIVTYYTGGAQLVQLFQQDEIWAAPVGRFSWGNLRRAGRPLGWATPKEGQTGGINLLCMVKGSPRRELAHRFIDFWLSADVQRALGQDLVDSPVNREAMLQGDARETMSDGSDLGASLALMQPSVALAQRENWLKDWNQKVAR